MAEATALNTELPAEPSDTINPVIVMCGDHSRSIREAVISHNPIELLKALPMPAAGGEAVEVKAVAARLAETVNATWPGRTRLIVLLASNMEIASRAIRFAWAGNPQACLISAPARPHVCGTYVLPLPVPEYRVHVIDGGDLVTGFPEYIREMPRSAIAVCTARRSSDDAAAAQELRRMAELTGLPARDLLCVVG